MSIKAFMKTYADREIELTKKIQIGNFEEPFEIKILTPDEFEAIERFSYDVRISKGGNRTKEINETKLRNNIVKTTIVTPDLTNAELQAFFKTPGDEVETLKRMLTAREYLELYNEISKLNGLSGDEKESELEEAVDEVKK
ncbi:phage tail assembly chaperone [Enterococcus cecorum]|uniref:phage tail assembly chaperone n=1 Tax=Enterococcus cecorum TaxID=44008 RepID=UPI0032C4534A